MKRNKMFFIRTIGVLSTLALLMFSMGSAPTNSSSTESDPFAALLGLIVVVGLVVFFVRRRKNRRAAQDKAKAGRIIDDADRYAAAKKAEADEYFAQKCSAAMTGSIGRVLPTSSGNCRYTLKLLARLLVQNFFCVDRYVLQKRIAHIEVPRQYLLGFSILKLG